MPAPRPPKRAARAVILAAAAAALLGAILAVVGSGMPPVDERSPYASAIAAFELARSPADVEAAIGPAGSEARTVVARVIKVDFAFLLLYPLLSLAIVAYLTRQRAARAA